MLRGPHRRLILLRRSTWRSCAAELPTCSLSDVIEEHLASELAEQGVTLTAGLTVRVASRKQMLMPALKEMKQRYGVHYAHEFPYLSQCILAFQKVKGRDVCLFAMYVQEYDADCPPPNTNRVYISYVDSVRYLKSEPAGARTVIYHALLSGYLKHAALMGFTHAHLWVAPPELGRGKQSFHRGLLRRRRGACDAEDAELDEAEVGSA